MYLADYHTHSLCSPDGSAPLTELCRAALEAGLDELCLTDHCDFIDYGGNPDFSFRWAPVEEQIARGKQLYGNRLTIRTGLELGEPWENLPLAQSIYSHAGVDFVLGSVHNLPLEEGGTDLYEIRYESLAQCYDVLDRYFAAMRLLLRTGCYDVLAHIIYPLRYMKERDGNQVVLDRYRDALAGIFDSVIRQGKGIEFNTCRGKTLEDWRWVMELYRDCGGRIVTLGSDAHTPEDVGAGIERAARLLRELGFRSYAVYTSHNAGWVEL